jgi:hypothetical protein
MQQSSENLLKQAANHNKIVKKMDRLHIPLRNMENKGLAADSNFF